MNLYHELRRRPFDEHVEFLKSKGLNDEQAEDFARNYQVSQATIKPLTGGPKFSQSPKFEEIKNRIEALRKVKREQR
jgi:hypothetical protein